MKKWFCFPCLSFYSNIYFSPINTWTNCASRRKSMKLCMESDHDRNQRPLRPTRWFLFLGILQIGMDLDRKKKSSKVLILYTVRKLIKNWANISKIVGSENGLVTSYSRLNILEIRLLTINVHNKSEFYEEIFLC